MADDAVFATGAVVRLSAAGKNALFAAMAFDHVREFARCHGTVVAIREAQVVVRWEPHQVAWSYPPAHVSIASLRAFHVVSPYDWGDDRSNLVYAYSTAHARSIGRGDLDALYEETYAVRRPLHDARASVVGVEGVESDPRYLRNAGWRCEDETDCESCGLAAMGLDEYEVCSECNLCPECGHDETCEEARA